MAGEKLFGEGIVPCCKHCEFAIQFFDNDKVLCKKRGVVLAEFKCRSFIYDPVKRIPQKPVVIEKLEEEMFKL